MMLMQLEVNMVPPINVVSVAQHLVGGRYEVIAEGYVEWFDTKSELRSWLACRPMAPLLIDRVLAKVKAEGICELLHTGLIIRDNHWVKPLSTIDWSMFKQASNECR